MHTGKVWQVNVRDPNSFFFLNTQCKCANPQDKRGQVDLRLLPGKSFLLGGVYCLADNQ